MSISSLLDISRRALSVHTQLIRTVGDNIANVSTEGYSRRRVDVVTTGSEGVNSSLTGTGVTVNCVESVVDKYLNGEVVSLTSDSAFASIREELLSRAEAPFTLTNEAGQIGYQMTAFFSALEDLQASPSDTALRTAVIQAGENLVSSISETYSTIASLQREADERVGSLLTDVNDLTSQIATLNSSISQAEATDPTQQALTLRDERQKLLSQLGELVSFNTVENSDGSVNVYLNNGFSLVNGNSSRSLSYTHTPTTGTYAPGLDGSALGHIVFNYDSAGASQVDLTSVIRSGTGEISGLLSVRGVQTEGETSTFDGTDGDLVEIASQIEDIARSLMSDFNTTYRGMVAGAPTAQKPDGTAPGVFGLFTVNGATDLGADGIVNSADLDAMEAAGTVTSFAGSLRFAVTSEQDFAAARSALSGDASNIDALLAQRDVELTTNSKSNVQGTIDDLYSSTVSLAGSLSATASENAEVYETKLTSAQELQSSISGVSLDEEFSKLISFQRGFEAAARMVNVADKMFEEIMGLLG